MLSHSIIQTFSRFVDINTRLYIIPSTWDPVRHEFVKGTKLYSRLHVVTTILDVTYRLWANIAYGFMIYRNLQNQSTVIRAFLPSLYLCAINWVSIIGLVSHVYQIEIEEFLNGFLKVNTYLGEKFRWLKKSSLV